ELWTPTAHASGFVIGGGLVLTSQRSIGTATTIEVQPGPRLKVAGNVVVADPVRDVAILRIEPASVASIQPVPLRCGQADAPSVAEGQRIVAIEAPVRAPKNTTPGAVNRITEHEIESDIYVTRGGTGGPVFTNDGAVVGITSVGDDSSGRRQS